MKTKPIIVERTFHTDSKTLWQALTDKNLMKLWYFDLPEFKVEVGFTFQFMGGHGGVQYVHLCEVTGVTPEKKLAYSWKYKGYGGMSYVTFELVAEGENTLLRLTHAGLETLPSANPDFAMHNFEEGWHQIIHISLNHFINTIINEK